MPEVETTAVAPPPVDLSLVTSRLNRGLTPQSIVCALAESVSHLAVPFDRCCLILPGHSRDEKRGVWRALSVAHGSNEVITAVFDAAETPFAPVLAEGAPRLFGESDLEGAVEEVGRGARSALVLPLSTDGRTFGALCFGHPAPGRYSTDDARNLQWLADIVAAATQAALCREQLESATETQHEIERLKSGFVHTLVRDIRLPLTNVLGLLELFENKLHAREPFDMEDRQLLTGAIEQGDRMRHLLDDLLEVAQQQERPLALHPEDTEAIELLADATEPLRGEAALRGVDLSVRVGRGTPELYVDIRQARRAVCHLLTVALAATRDGSRISIEAQSFTGTRGGEAGRHFVIINIADSSDGLPAEEVPYVFDAFWRASDPQRRAGQGVGLSIAKRIAAAHGGNVSVRSQLGAGTIYSILLPARAPRHEAARGSRRILVVDDSPEVLLLFGKLIEIMGYQVLTAPSAARALEILDEQRVDLLITDWAMPGMNGGELVSAVKHEERWRSIPTVVLTGHDMDLERCSAQAAGSDRFLVKPVMRDELERVLADLIRAEEQVST